jgi:VanZ family protein
LASNWLRDHGVLRLTVASMFAVALAALLVFLLRQPRFRTWRLLAVLLGLAALYAAAATQSETPEERLHLLEYGGVALLTELALPAGMRGTRRFVIALVITVATGWCDELIQGLLPNRHYDLHDVALNAVSGLLALTGRYVIPRFGQRIS